MDIRFSTLAEAEELNSKCAFCGKLKFSIRDIHVGRDKMEYSLERCDVKNCKHHCKFDHQSEKIQLQDGREDVVEIASGWSSS